MTASRPVTVIVTVYGNAMMTILAYESRSSRSHRLDSPGGQSLKSFLVGQARTRPERPN